jgi:hypothetical protein
LSKTLKSLEKYLRKFVMQAHYYKYKMVARSRFELLSPGFFS